MQDVNPGVSAKPDAGVCALVGSGDAAVLPLSGEEGNISLVETADAVVAGAVVGRGNSVAGGCASCDDDRALLPDSLSYRVSSFNEISCSRVIPPDRVSDRATVSKNAGNFTGFLC
jgi:hypothetical protein